MAYEYLNLNPLHKTVGDCVIRALALALDEPWDKIYIALAIQGFLFKDMPTSNRVWGSYLMENGFDRYVIPDTCPIDCYTIERFAEDNPKGLFVVGTDTHVVTIIDGTVFDTWFSLDCTPTHVYVKK